LVLVYKYTFRVFFSTIGVFAMGLGFGL